jgi:hypothetical protein
MSTHLVLSFENHPSLNVLSAFAVIDGVEVKVQLTRIRPPQLPPQLVAQGAPPLFATRTSEVLENSRTYTANRIGQICHPV